MYKLFATTALSALVAGCATFDSQPMGSADAGIALEMASNALVFRDVRVETTPQGANLVTGTLRRIGHRPVRAGYLDYRLTDTNGTVLEQGQVSDSRASQRPHPDQASAFSIPLQRRWIPVQYRLYIKWDDAAHTDSPT